MSAALWVSNALGAMLTLLVEIYNFWAELLSALGF